MTEFFERSKAIANDYIQSIVFLDDKAYQEESSEEFKQHDFKASEVTKIFAQKSKICAVYKPYQASDLDDFKIIANKADVVILDWQINLNAQVEIENSEEDEDDEPRGVYTVPIIKNLLFDGDKLKDSLKLIVVYTGDYTILEVITQKIFDDLLLDNFGFKINVKDCKIELDSFRILIRAKEIEFNTDTLREQYESKCISYDRLSEFILDEFTELTAGLLSNFALMSLTTLRKNSSKILSLFSKDMDCAYFGHKSILPKQEEAEDLLVELFGDSIKDLLYYSQVNNCLRDNLINPWIEDKVLEERIEYKTYTYDRTHQTLKEILKSKDEVVKTRFASVITPIDAQFKNYLIQNPTMVFTNNSDKTKIEENDKNFSKLTHHKSLFIPKNIAPKLTLGTLIKSNKYEVYYICIQQKCDSVRIPKDDERKFIFIPLTISTDKFDILTPEGIKLKKDKSSFSIRTIKFICTDVHGVILAEKNEDNKFIFKQKYNAAEDEQFEWILDLKDLHSQRIIIDYTSQLSRVGLDESEWHRRFLS